MDWVWSLVTCNDLLISGSQDNTIKVWDLATCELRRTLEGHLDCVYSLAVLGVRLFSGSREKNLQRLEHADVGAGANA